MTARRTVVRLPGVEDGGNPPRESPKAGNFPATLIWFDDPAFWGKTAAEKEGRQQVK